MSLLWINADESNGQFHCIRDVRAVATLQLPRRWKLLENICMLKNCTGPIRVHNTASIMKGRPSLRIRRAQQYQRPHV